MWPDAPKSNPNYCYPAYIRYVSVPYNLSNYVLTVDL